ncbi:dihydroorotate dehydrogenase [Candidatus Woesearchaeota archaeon]|nr:MAG: dihydroorotate dehydrogenase [Candidatus Woesearchaeota archaeon]
MKAANETNPDVTTEVAGIKLNSPLVLASGILGTSSDILKRVASEGAGAVTMKSIGPVEREGHPNPNVIEFGFGMLNAVGLPTPGVDNVLQEMEELKTSPVPVIASVYGSTVDDFVMIVEKLKPYKPAAFELDISCPNKEDGLAFMASEDVVYKLVSSVKKAAGNIPVIPKLSPNTHSIPRIAAACKKAGADALCAINTASAMVINIEARKPVLAYKKGGLSGPALKPIAVRCVYEAYQATGLPIIGTGGVTTGRDAIEMIMAGASAVGMGTAVYYRGISAFREVLGEMKEWMRNNNVRSVKEIIGAAHY